MKNLMRLFVILFVFYSTLSFAQYGPAPIPTRHSDRFNAADLRFGIHLSPTWSWMSTDNGKINSVGTVLGLRLGLVAENRISEAYSVSSGVNLYFNGGGKLSVDVPNHLFINAASEFSPRPADSLVYQSGAQYRYTLSFIEIPFGLKLRTPESGEHLRWFAEPHLALGLRTAATGSTVGLGYSGIYDQEKLNIKTEVNSINLAWGIGGGAEYIITNNTAIVVGLYYQSGFVDLTDDNSGVIYDADGKNKRLDTSKGTLNSISLRLGLMF